MSNATTTQNASEASLASASAKTKERKVPKSTSEIIKRSLLNIAIKIVPMFIIGLSLGWLLGWSETPLIKDALTILFALAATVTALGANFRLPTSLGGGPDRPRGGWRGNPWPLAVMVVGIAVGGPVGLKARFSGWIVNPQVVEIIEKTSDPTTQVITVKTRRELRNPGLRNSLTVNETTIAELKQLPLNELERELLKLHDETLTRWLKEYRGKPEILQALIRELP